MKVAHLIAQFYPHIGGAEICIHNISSALTDRGCDATVVTTTAPPLRPPDLPYNMIYLWNRTCGLLRKIPFLGKFYLHSCLKELQDKHNFDIWQVTMGYPLGVYAVEFFKKHNIPCVLRCCGEDIQKFPEINYGYRLDAGIDSLVRRFYPEYDGLIALTPTVKNEYLDLGIPENKIRIIPNGADCSKFSGIAADSDFLQQVKDSFNAGNKKIILTTGRYHPKKGFDYIPECAAHLQKLGIEFVWIIAGPGAGKLNDKFPELENLGIVCTEKFSKGDEGAFSLPPDSLVALYCAADIFVLPTRVETFGMVLVEAMAAGLPIVTTDAPGVCDVIDDQVNGLKVESDNPVQIAEAAASVLSDKDKADLLSGNALKTAEAKYDWPVVTTAYAEFYNEILNKAASR